jgi:hypothetical protein
MAETRLIDYDLGNLKEHIHGLFGPPGTMEVDSVAEYVEFLMARYALAAIHDNKVCKEAEAICEKHKDSGW